MVRIHPDPPTDARPGSNGFHLMRGAIAQLGERLLCKQEVTGSIPVGSTRFSWRRSTECSAQARAFAVHFVLFGCSLKIWKKQGESDCLKRSGSSG